MRRLDVTNRIRLTPQVIVSVGCGLLLLNAGCQTSERLAGPVRAIWVTRFDYQTADDVVRVMDNCAEAGFNTVLFQVRGNGTAFYDSAHEPWAEELGGTDPGFDPLSLACREAHERNMELHAWVNVMPAWRGTTPPADPDQLYHQHPEWFWYDQHGQRQALSGFYVSLNPCLPEVRAYLVEVFRDIVLRYAVDGLHLDYIRFPNEAPATPKGSGIDYPRDERTLALYHQDTGLAPEDDKHAWKQWRTEQVTQLVADIHAMMRRAKPKAALSAAVGTIRNRSLHHFRDGERWVADGIIDAAFPMNYKDDLAAFETGLTMWMPHTEEVTVVPGLWFSPRVAPEEVNELVRRQIEMAREETGNFCLFAYASLFERGEKESPERDATTHSALEERRQVLLPFLQSLHESDVLNE